MNYSLDDIEHIERSAYIAGDAVMQRLAASALDAAAEADRLDGEQDRANDLEVVLDGLPTRSAVDETLVTLEDLILRLDTNALDETEIYDAHELAVRAHTRLGEP